jgi:hypothetical protein
MTRLQRLTLMLAVASLERTIMKEFELRDPDGYWLWFGQSTAEPPTVRE